MFMQKSSNLLFQTESPLGVAHGCSVLKQVPLDFGGEIVPLKDNRSAQTPQNTLFGRLKRDVLSESRPLWRFRSSAIALPTTEGLGEIIKASRNLLCVDHGLSVARDGDLFIPPVAIGIDVSSSSRSEKSRSEVE